MLCRDQQGRARISLSVHDHALQLAAAANCSQPWDSCGTHAEEAQLVLHPVLSHLLLGDGRACRQGRGSSAVLRRAPLDGGSAGGGQRRPRVPLSSPGSPFQSFSFGSVTTLP